MCTCARCINGHPPTFEQPARCTRAHAIALQAVASSDDEVYRVDGSELQTVRCRRMWTSPLPPLHAPLQAHASAHAHTHKYTHARVARHQHQRPHIHCTHHPSLLQVTVLGRIVGVRDGNMSITLTITDSTGQMELDHWLSEDTDAVRLWGACARKQLR